MLKFNELQHLHEFFYLFEFLATLGQAKWTIEPKALASWGCIMQLYFESSCIFPSMLCLKFTLPLSVLIKAKGGKHALTPYETSYRI